MNDEVAEIGDALVFEWSQRQVHVEGHAAWVRAIGEYRYGAPDDPPQGGPYRLTAVFVRRDGRWRWHTYSGSELVG